MTNKEIIELVQKYLMKNKHCFPIAIVKGKGARVWDIHNRAYIDLTGVSHLGHCSGKVISAIRHWSGKLINSPSYFLPEIKLAKRLNQLAFHGKVLFLNNEFEAKEFAKKLSKENSAIQIADETNIPIGITGEWFAYQEQKLKPDILVLGSGLVSGMPFGVILMKEEIANNLKEVAVVPSSSNVLIYVMVLAVLETIQKDKLLTYAKEMGNYFIERIKELKNRFSIIKNVSGKGFMLDIELTNSAAQIKEYCFKEGVLINTNENTISLLDNSAKASLKIIAPLVITKKQIDYCVKALEGGLKCQK